MNKYTSSNIKVLKDLQAVRKRPGMYIGSNGPAGLHQLVWEIVDNAVDEFLAGYGKEIKVTIQSNNQVTVTDEGRGIPTGPHSYGGSTPKVIFTNLHAGGKFDSLSYQTAGGLHGVGASVVNALSSQLTVTIYRHGKIHQISFHHGGRVKKRLHTTGQTKQTGTTITFRPDPKIFGEIKLDYPLICQRLQESALLNSGLQFIATDLRGPTKRETKYCYTNGLPVFMQLLNKDKKLVTPLINLPKTTLSQINCQVVMQINEGFDGNVVSYVNNVKTPAGGSHELGFGQGCVKAINQFYRDYRYLKQRDKNFELREIKEGLTAIIVVYVPETLLQFEGQTKTKLSSPLVRTVIEKMVNQALLFWLNEHRQAAEKWLAKIKLTRSIRVKSKRLRSNARNKAAKRLVNSKLIPARSNDPARCELFLVEGESAGSTAKQGRDSEFQAVLALKGKCLNSERASLSEIVKNAELNNIISAIGAGWDHSFKLTQVKYRKVIIMTDADTDGAHIQALLLTFFYRFMQPLILAGYVYVAMPPLYRVQTTSQDPPLYIATQQQFDQLVAQKVPFRVQRFKGLGEMNADQLWTTTMDPAQRQLIQVTPADGPAQIAQIATVMGNHIPERRTWIEQNVNFN